MGDLGNADSYEWLEGAAGSARPTNGRLRLVIGKALVPVGVIGALSCSAVLAWTNRRAVRMPERSARVRVASPAAPAPPGCRPEEAACRVVAG